MSLQHPATRRTKMILAILCFCLVFRHLKHSRSDRTYMLSVSQSVASQGARRRTLLLVEVRIQRRQWLHDVSFARRITPYARVETPLGNGIAIAPPRSSPWAQTFSTRM